MTKRNLLTISIIGIMLLSCNLKKNSIEKTIYIGAERKHCDAGVMQKECLQVKWAKDQKEWEFFYDDIEGFTYENGNEYELIVSEEKVENSPADASSFKYKLVKAVSKKKVETTTMDDEHNGQNSLDWEGAYEGTLPCADCEGIKTTISLNQDNTYTLTEEYLGKKGKSFVTKGSFTWDGDGSKITLTDGNRKQQYQVGENKLIHLDMDGNAIKDQLADKYVLSKKQNETSSINVNNSVENKKWRLIELAGNPVKGNAQKHYIIFHSKEKSIETKADCNVMQFGYKLTNGFELKTTQGLSTMMACPEGSLEDALKNAILEADNITFGNGNLSLNRGRMSPLARFELDK